MPTTTLGAALEPVDHVDTLDQGYYVCAHALIACTVSSVAASFLESAGDFEGTEHFEVRHKLGAGGFGTVYAAFDRRRGCEVALKVLHDPRAGALARLQTEFHTMKGISHPNLARLYELFCDGDRCFYTMEAVKGRSILDCGCAAPQQARHLFAQLARGVKALHGFGMLHCDLKPANVLVTERGLVKILDFGAAREMADKAAPSARLWTPGYSSPEQMAGAALGPSSDWYSFGAMLKECIGLEGPRDLAELARELLAVDPSSRPDGAEVLFRLETADLEIPPRR